MMTNKLKKTIIDGVEVSPVLPSSIKNYLIDIDGTICDDIPNEQPELMKSAKLYPDALKTLNKWYDEGHIITFFTSRLEEHRQVTEEWLEKNGFKVVIYANQMLRAAYPAMKIAAETILKNKRSYELEKKISSVKEIINLIK